MHDQEGRVTHFSSGIAGVAVVLFALMGTIGVGYLLNGASGYETVNDYEYVTDVTGLYSYTPVTAYADYSPAQNNYQYNTDSSLLGTYTAGINYTAASAANLNPIITPDSGLHTHTHTISVSDFPTVMTTISSATSNELWVYVGSSSTYNTPAFDSVEARAIVLSDLVDGYETYTAGTLTIPAPQSVSLTLTSLTAQTVGVYCGGEQINRNQPSQLAAEAASTSANTTLAYYNSDVRLWTTGTETSSFTTGGVTYNMAAPVGILSDITVNPNGTATYSYTYGGSTTTVTKNQSEVILVCWDPSSVDSMTLTYTSQSYTDIDYLDPNYGVSLSGSEVYWSNGSNLGAVTWAFEKPSSSSSITVQAYNGSTALSGCSFTVSYSSSWNLTYTSSGVSTTVDLGSQWPAVYIRMYYTGELQVGAIDGFFNFTNYTLKTATTYTTDYTGNVSITMCKLSGSSSMNFACIGTTIESGTVPGAMYDASLTVANYFPDYTNVRLSFDSTAYVGTSVTVSTWSMSVDSSTFVGTFTVDGTTYYADLTQPWAIIWDPAGHVDITFSGVNELGTNTVTILSSLTSPAVALGGQWVTDTDLYTVDNHEEEVYKWNIGQWGLDKTQFLVCAMGLTALVSIMMKLGGVPFRMLDFIVILFGNVIFWVIM